jgi:hypothetical protein
VQTTSNSELKFAHGGWDIERDTIAKIEGGTRWVCDSELIELARALGRPLVDLFPARVQAVVRGRR